MNVNYSELHARLNHLVNYSSQLIFVSSDSIAEQHRTLEVFMAEQSEQTEVAYISAELNDDEIAYRRQLCRQLLGQVAGRFVRPLNELLVSLNHHDGPVLIGITQAQFISNAFLQELWDLVLQSRFAANKQHLNIVLFGDRQWAEKAQAWLPAKNTATPLLLRSEAIDNVQSELEQLIALKRSAFQKRIEQRTQAAHPQHNKSIMRKPLFAFLVIVVLAISFGGMLSWQYPDRMKLLLGFNSNTESQPVQTNTDLMASSHTEVNSPKELSIANSEAPPRSTEDRSPAKLQPENEPVERVTLSQAETPRNDEFSVADSLLVSNWQQRDPVPAHTNPPDVIQQSQKPVPTVNESTEQRTKTNTSIDDYSSVPQLPAVSDQHYLIQIAGLQKRDLALQYIKDQNMETLIWVYETQRYGGKWYVIVYRQLFDSWDAAQRHMAQLPVLNPQSPPFIKSGAQVNRELTNK